jgi:quercetin dioxygenase-like cupin family protein/hemerythrin-like domain-containing protein
MEVLLSRLEQALSGLNEQDFNTVEPIRAVMADIVPEMNTHFACEEQALFPAVSPYHSMVLMEVEHEDLFALRNELMIFLAEPEPAPEAISGFRKTTGRFINEMLDHIGREDAGIFPTCEQALSDDEKQDVIEKMDAIRAQAQETPTPGISRPERSFQVFPVDLGSPAQRSVFSERLAEPGGLEIKHLVIRAGDAIPQHWSPKQGTLVCLKGEGTFKANGQEALLKSGVTIVMSPQLLHGVQASSDCHLLLILH